MVLERGRVLGPIKDYPRATQHSLGFIYQGDIPQKVKDENAIVSRSYGFKKATKHFVVKDTEARIPHDKDDKVWAT